MKAELIKAPIWGLQGNIGILPLTKCPQKVEERHTWALLGSDPARYTKCVKIPVSRRNRHLFPQVLKDEIHNLWRFNQGPQSGFGSFPAETIKPKYDRMWERGNSTQVPICTQMSNNASPTWSLFSSSLIPQALLPGEWMFKRRQWVVPLIVPKHA